ncbi:hypothetical protein ES708_31518 [subsurface metagenome]
MEKCDMCFQDRTPLFSIVPGATARVCKSCNYKLMNVVAFLEYYHVKLQYELPEEPLPPLPKAKGKAGTDES